MTALEAITLVPGAASGAPLELAEPLSFWGGFDATTGTIIGPATIPSTAPA
jgi:predicted aconitase with swiveling domain